MPPEVDLAAFYRREAKRLYSMAEEPAHAAVRADLIKIAERYEILAKQEETNRRTR